MVSKSKREPMSLSSNGTLGSRPIAKRVDLNQLVSKGLGQGYANFGVVLPYLVQILESYDLLRAQRTAPTPEPCFTQSSFLRRISNADSDICVDGLCMSLNTTPWYL